LTGA